MTQFKRALLIIPLCLKSLSHSLGKKERGLISAASQAHHKQIPATYGAEASQATCQLKTVQKEFRKH